MQKTITLINQFIHLDLTESIPGLHKSMIFIISTIKFSDIKIQLFGELLRNLSKILRRISKNKTKDLSGIRKPCKYRAEMVDKPQVLMVNIQKPSIYKNKRHYQ